jgi:6-pyruvoyltetrahydropterin/6-carboxytetrahydropterin synthase
MVIDLVQMDATVRRVLDGLDFHHIDREVPAFAARPSTAENIVVYLWDELGPRFEGNLRHLKLWETRKNVFEYSGIE